MSYMVFRKKTLVFLIQVCYNVDIKNLCREDICL